MREQSINQSCSILYPKTVSCQTDSTTFQSRTSQTTCQVENCFCSSSQARSSSTRWRSMFRAMGSMVLVLLIFTFLGGLELDHAVYYPVTWYPLRWAVGDWLPSPLVTMSYQTVSSRVW